MEFSGYIINLISSFIAVEYINYIFINKFTGWKQRSLFLGGCMIYFMVVTVLNHIITFEGILGFSYALVLAGYGLLALKGNLQDFLLAGFLWMLIVLVGTYGILSVMSIFTGKELEEILSMGEDQLLYASLIALVVKFCMGRVAASMLRRREDFSRQENGMVAAAFGFMCFLAVAIFCMEVGGMGAGQRYWLTIGILISEIGIIILLGSLYKSLVNYQREKLEEECRRKMEEERREALLDVYRIGREINHWRHDMLSKLSVLYRMQSNQKYDAVKEYMEELYEVLKDYPELPQPTGNEGLDAALMKAIPKCKENGITFHYFVLGNMEKIESIAMGTLVDNLLNNGIEACMEITEGSRELEIVIQHTGTGVEILQENSIAKSVIQNNPNLRSRKEDAPWHGFGMKSIYHIVEEWEGMYEYWEEEGKFCQRIYLTYRQENE